MSFGAPAYASHPLNPMFAIAVTDLIFSVSNDFCVMQILLSSLFNHSPPFSLILSLLLVKQTSHHWPTYELCKNLGVSQHQLGYQLCKNLSIS